MAEPGGTLTLLNNQTYTTGSLTVAGSLVMQTSSLSAAQLAISAGGSVALLGSTVSAAQVTISAGGIVSGGGTITGQVTNDGTIEAVSTTGQFEYVSLNGYLLVSGTGHWYWLVRGGYRHDR